MEWTPLNTPLAWGVLVAFLARAAGRGSRPKLLSFSPSVFFLPHMAELRLEGNFLHRLPNEISALQHLKFIDLSRNQFHDFPEQLTTLPALETINLEENEIVGEWTLPLSSTPFSSAFLQLPFLSEAHGLKQHQAWGCGVTFSETRGQRWAFWPEMVEHRALNPPREPP